jgi:hypothetical protein
MNRGYTQKTGYKGSQTLISPGAAGTPATGPGGLTSLLAAAFDRSSVYSISFSITAAQILAANILNTMGVPIPVDPTLVGSIIGVRCIAVLSAKCEGVPIRRVFDIGQGTTVSLPCESVDVAIQDMTFSVLGPGHVAYTVSATVTRDCRPSTALPAAILANPNPATGGSYTLLTGTGIQIPIPLDSGITSVSVDAIDTTGSGTGCAPPTALRVTHFQGVHAQKIYSAATESGFVKLAPGTTVVEMANNGPNTVITTIEFGVDG